ncbi:MAG TPA: hypothetical protein VKH37_04915, partial [Ferruginibacter sp.]|nr:hypothetical protein [Ferruginibacter sp.]
NVSRSEYLIYTFSVSLFSVAFMLVIFYLMKKNNYGLLAKTVWCFLIFFLMIVGCEYYLHTHWIGKG